MAVRRKRVVSYANGEDYLQTVKELRLRLESNEVISFSLRAELEMPEDTDGMFRLLCDIPARLAFWSYQTERALAHLRSLEEDLRKLEGDTYLTYRGMYQRDRGEIPTEATLRSYVDSNVDVRVFRRKVNASRKTFATVRAFRDGVSTLNVVLRRLTAHESQHHA